MRRPRRGYQHVHVALAGLALRHKVAVEASAGLPPRAVESNACHEDGGRRSGRVHRAGRGARAGVQLARVWAGLRGARGSRPGIGAPLRAVVAMYDGSHAMGGVHGVSELHLGLSHRVVERVLPSDSLGDGGARSA